MSRRTTHTARSTRVSKALSRHVFNQLTDECCIADPDEFANNRNNAAYTNAGVSVILKNAVTLAGILGVNVPSNWTDISDKVVVLSDNSSDIILEYDGFNGTTAVKQADVIVSRS
jgi:trehalose/maltose hydrolase-like predicted phosphorylase